MREDNIQLRDAYIPCVTVDKVDDRELENARVQFGEETKLFLDADRGKHAARKDSTSDYASEMTNAILDAIPKNIHHKLLLPQAN